MYRSSIFFSLIFMIQTDCTYCKDVEEATFIVYVSCFYAQHTKLNYHRERLTLQDLHVDFKCNSSYRACSYERAFLLLIKNAYYCDLSSDGNLACSVFSINKICFFTSWTTEHSIKTINPMSFS